MQYIGCLISETETATHFDSLAFKHIIHFKLFMLIQNVNAQISFCYSVEENYSLINDCANDISSSSSVVFDESSGRTIKWASSSGQSPPLKAKITCQYA